LRRTLQKNLNRVLCLVLVLLMVLLPAIVGLPDTAMAAGPQVGLIQVTKTPINIRSNAGTNYSIVGTLSNSRLVYVLSSKKGTDGRTWYNIALSAEGEAYGWISSVYLGCITTVKKDAEFDAYLEKQGFPRSYWDNLRVLHSIYPNWKFEAVHTGLKWADAVDAEDGKKNNNYVAPNFLSEYGSKYVDTTDVNSQGNQISHDGGWYKASKDIIAYYMDPRNWLDDEHIFQFEKLEGVDDVYTEKIIASGASGTFMDGSYSNSTSIGIKQYKNGTFTYKVDGEKKETTFAKAIFELSKTHNINPFHVLSRIRVEMGTEGTSNLAWGAVSGYENCFNFCNIGAYAHSGRGAQTNGAIFAQGKGWTDPYKALDGGIKFLRDKYIGVGQNTIYTQKFDVVTETPYDHQYMTNVMAPAQESLSTSQMLEKAIGKDYNQMGFVFAIPVYLDMPENACENPASSQFVPSSNLTTDSVIASETYEINLSSITGIPEETKKEALLEGIDVVLEGGTMHLFDKDGNEKEEATTVGTGDRLQIWDVDGEFFKEYAIIIYGDVDGNGKIALRDLLNLQKHLLKTDELTDSYLDAADVSRDNKVSVLDLLNIQKHLLGTQKITQQ